jgi:signal transduction histidine kinase
MKRNVPDMSKRYLEALRRHLQQGRQAGKQPAQALGLEALAGGLRTADLAKLHEQVMVADLLPASPANKRATLRSQAGRFFATAIATLERADQTAACGRLTKAIDVLARRTVELASSNLKFSAENTRRKKVEKELKRSERHYWESLKQSELLREQLRRLSRQMLSSQEDERRKISRELHDVIAEALTAINIRLANLKKEGSLHNRDLARNIAATQRIVQKSVDTVHQFARELRPAMLDDLGLIPALHSYLKHFMSQTGIRVALTAFEGLDELDPARRTALYRVAQEALTNVVRHARASSVDVDVARNETGLRMRIHDGGVGFAVKPVLLTRGNKHLGLLGMRERLEMVGGRFQIESSVGKGTTITAHVPCGNHKPARSSP